MHTVIGLTGERDFVSDGTRLATVANGDPLMAKVTAMGCAGSALVAAFLAVESDAWLATTAALIAFGVAGEVAAARARGPGSFAVGDHRCAARARPRHADRQGEGDVMAKAALDLRLYAIVDPEVSGGHDLADLSRQLAAGGATLVQLRDKLSDTRVMVERARAVKAALGKVPLLINDRVDVALAAAPTACTSAGTTWRRRTRGGCSAPTPSSGSPSTRRSAPTRPISA